MSLILDDLLEQLAGVQRAGKGWNAYCPAHDDTKHRSLSISRSASNPKHAVVHCHSGCTYKDIVSSLRSGEKINVKVATVQSAVKTNGAAHRSSPNGHSTNGKPLAMKKLEIPGPTPLEWLSEYTSLSQEFLESQDIDFSKKGRVGYVFKKSSAIKWRFYTRDQKGLWDLQGDEPPPLWPTLPDSLEDSVVFISAGETDCLCLRACGVDAFALTRGESASLSRNLFRELKELGTREVVYVPDADSPGHKAVSAIRRKAEAAGLDFRALDIEAHLQASRGEKDLRSLVRRVGIDQVQAALESEYVKGPKTILANIDQSKEEGQIWWVANPIIAKGAVTLLSGEAKAGKTTFMFKVLDAMRQGGDVVGYPIRKGKVVYFTENTELVISQKARQIFKGSPTAHIKVIYRDNEDLEGLEFGEGIALVFENAKRFGADLVVVDTLAGLSAIEDENEAASVARALRPFRVAAKRHDVAVVLVHHLGKSGSERGSTVLLSEPDILVRIEGGSTADRIRTIKIKNNLVLNQPDDKYFTMDENGDYVSGMQTNDYDMLVLQMLPHKVEEAMSIRTLAERMEMPWSRQTRDKIAHVLEKLVTMGKVAGDIVWEGQLHQRRYYRVIGITVSGGKKKRKQSDEDVEDEE